MVQGVDDASFQQHERHLGTNASRSRQSPKEESERAGRDEGRSARGEEEHVDSANEVDVDQGLKVLGGGAIVGIDDADNTETSEFDKALVRVSQTVANYWPDATDHREVFNRDVSAAV